MTLRLNDLIREADVYKRFQGLFKHRELRVARQQGKIEFFKLKKGAYFYTEKQLADYIERIREEQCQKQNLRAKRASAAERFEFGGQWLSQERGIYCRNWYDAKNKRSHRRSLGTRDPEEAKVALALIVTSEPAQEKDETAPDVVLLSAVFAFYLKEKGNQPARAALTCPDFSDHR